MNCIMFLLLLLCVHLHVTQNTLDIIITATLCLACARVTTVLPSCHLMPPTQLHV